MSLGISDAIPSNSHLLPPTTASVITAYKSLIHLLVPLSASILHGAPSIFPTLLLSFYRLSTSKHFPFKPHLPHPHMALSALPSKQFTEPLTTTALKLVLKIQDFFICNYLKLLCSCIHKNVVPTIPKPCKRKTDNISR